MVLLYFIRSFLTGIGKENGAYALGHPNVPFLPSGKRVPNLRYNINGCYPRVVCKVIPLRHRLVCVDVKLIRICFCCIEENIQVI
jgi:hypothetical protein